jgi:hypothetical protein
MVEGVAAELELETAPFLISPMASGGNMRGGYAENQGFVSAFDGEIKGRQDR